MTRRRAGLHAILAAGGDRILCGRCKQPIGRVVRDVLYGERVAVVAESWGPDSDGVWRRLPRADAAARQGRRPTRRPLPGDGGYGRPPDGYVIGRDEVRVECDACQSRQLLTPDRLRLAYRAAAAGESATGPWWDEPTPG